MTTLSLLARRVAGFADEHGLLPRGATVVLAVSGGPDSVALLHVLHELAPVRQLRLVVAHYQHRLRGEESVGDEVFVRAVSRELDLPFERGEGPPRAGGSQETWARQSRYRFLEDVRRRCGGQIVATGHTADDQVETVLMRLARGTGLGALEGIPVKRDSIVRPLLGVWRRELLVYLHASGRSYRLDSSNLAPAAERNRLRNLVIPAWTGAMGDWVRTGIARTACNLREARGYLQEKLDRAAEAACCESEGVTTLDLSVFWTYHPYLQRELLLRLARRAGASGRELGRAGVGRLAALCLRAKAGGRVELPGGGVAARYGNTLHLCADRFRRTGPFSFRLPVPGRIDTRPGGTVLDAQLLPSRPEWYPGDGVRRICLPYEAVGETRWLLVRNRRPGDRLRVGVTARKKLKDLYQEERVPRWSRAAKVAVVAGTELVWVVGVRRSWDAGARGDTGPFLVVRAEASGEA